MSADNGLLLWHDGQRYLLSDYCASRDYGSNADMRRRSEHPTAASALIEAAELLKQGYEYGLSLDLDSELLRAESRATLMVPIIDDVFVSNGPRGRPSALAER